MILMVTKFFISLVIFPTTPSLLHKEGSTAFPKPFSPQGTRDVAGGAIALPGFWYRQRSSRPQGAADDCFDAIKLRLLDA